MQLSLAQLCKAVQGAYEIAPTDDSVLVSGVTWDSRTVRPGNLYVALPGERVDGHAFVGTALEAGARCALVTQECEASVKEAARRAGAALVRVKDSQAALVDLAAFWRACLSGTVVGLTGSSGKTTTKNLVRDVLAHGLSVTATSGNQNNELGVPKTLLSAAADDDAVVVEMGMRGLGQIKELCGFVRPDWGVLVNVGTSHMELLGSRDNIARAKAELLEALPEGGWAFINGVDDYAAFVRDQARLRERGVNIAVFDGSPDAASRMNVLKGAKLAEADVEGAAVRCSDARVWAEDIALDEEGRATFKLCAARFPSLPGQNPVGEAAATKASYAPETSEIAKIVETVELAECTLSLPGIHNVGNACAAAAVGRAMGMPLSAIAEALSQAQAESGRAQVLRTDAGVTVVDDSYNANPDSMRASLRTFSAMRVAGRKFAVLGDMGELGPYSDEGHSRVGADAAQAGIDVLVCVGPLARGIAQAARLEGVPDDRVLCVDDAQAALAQVAPLLQNGDAVLVKASHSVGLERVVEGLVG